MDLFKTTELLSKGYAFYMLVSSEGLVFACVEVDSQTASSTELATTVLASRQSQTGSYITAVPCNLKC